MSQPSQDLPESVSKSICAKWLTWQSLEPYWGCAGEYSEPLHDALALVERRCRDEILHQQHSGDLSLWLVETADDIAATLSVPDVAKSACERALRELDRVLRGPAEDVHDRLAAVVVGALGVASAAAEAAGLPVPKELVAGTSLRISWGQQSRNVIESPCNATATTRYQAWPATTIGLRLVPKKFDSATIASLPYAFVHEAVCHVLQGPYNGSRKASAMGSAFGEGWMDLAALQAFEAATRSPEHAACFAVGLPMATVRLAGQAFHRARTDHRPLDEQDQSWAGRRLGVDAARRIVGELASLVGSPSAGEQVFLKASLRLNQSAWSPARRDRAVVEWYEAAHDGRGQDVADSLAIFAESGDLALLDSSFT